MGLSHRFIWYSRQNHVVIGHYSNLEIDSEDLAVYVAQYSKYLIELHLDYFGRKVRRMLECRTAEHEYIFDIVNHSVLCDGKLIDEFFESTNDMYIREMEHFLDEIANNAVSVNTISRAIATVRIALGMGQHISLNTTGKSV